MKNKAIFIPIVLVELYLIITVLCFALGPFKYPLMNPIRFYSLIFIYQISLFLGYYIAIKRHKPNRVIFNTNELVLKIVKILLVLNVFFILFLMMREFGLSEFSFQEIISRIRLGITSPGTVYNLKFSITSENIFLGKIGSVLVVFGQPIFYLVIPTALMFFNKLNTTWKIFLFTNIILEISKAIGLGTTKGTFDLFIMLFVTISLFFFKKIYDNKITKKQIAFALFSIFIVVSLILAFFSNNVSDRGVGETVKKDEIHMTGLNTVPYDTNCALYKVVPKSLQNVSTLIISYVSQGYYGFELSLNQNIIPMFGIGNSMFMQRYVDEYIFNVSQLSLQYRIIPDNWDPYVNWHSLYSWFANDFGFLGVVFVMLMIGYFFGVFLIESMNENIFAKLLLVLLVIMILFIPMNSQIFSFMTYFCSFSLLSFCYLIFRK